PPSGPMVLYGVVTNTSIGGLFMAGLVPGLMIAAIFVAWSMVSPARSRRHTARAPRASPPGAAAAIPGSAWAPSLPVSALGGMYAGVFTATEAAAAGALLALGVGIVVYRTLPFAAIWNCAIDASRTAAMLFMILAGASVFGFVLTKLRIPQQIVET